VLVHELHVHDDEGEIELARIQAYQRMHVINSIGKSLPICQTKLQEDFGKGGYVDKGGESTREE
jgi:hypothetical protein